MLDNGARLSWIALRSRIPTSDEAIAGDHHKGIVGNTVDEYVTAFLSRLRACAPARLFSLPSLRQISNDLEIPRSAPNSSRNAIFVTCAQNRPPPWRIRHCARSAKA